MTPLHRCVCKGNLEAVQLLLNTGKVYVDAQDREGNSSLHMAAEEEQVEMYKLLLQAGKADFKLQNKAKQIALELVKSHQNFKCLKVFTEKWDSENK